MSIVRMEEVGGKSLERANKILAGIPGGVEKAVNSAMQRTVSHLRTKSSEVIQEKYDISKAAIRSNENITIQYTYSSGVTALVSFSGCKIPLYRYGGASPKSPAVDKSVWATAMINGFYKRIHPGISATGHQFKDTSPMRYNDAFVATMKSGHTGIFERTGGATASGSDEIKELMGSSVAQMLGNKEVEDKLAKSAFEKFDERMEHEISRVLNGWG